MILRGVAQRGRLEMRKLALAPRQNADADALRAWIESDGDTLQDFSLQDQLGRASAAAAMYATIMSQASASPEARLRWLGPRSLPEPVSPVDAQLLLLNPGLAAPGRDVWEDDAAFRLWLQACYRRRRLLELAWVLSARRGVPVWIAEAHWHAAQFAHAEARRHWAGGAEPELDSVVTALTAIAKATKILGERDGR